MALNPLKVAAGYMVLHLAGTWLYLELVPGWGGKSFEYVVNALTWLYIMECVLIVGSLFVYRRWAKRNRMLSAVLILLLLLPWLSLLPGTVFLHRK